MKQPGTGSSAEDMTTSGVKFDGDKVRMDLLDPEFLHGVAEVLTLGAQKYDDHNWRKGIVFSRLYGATQRHLNAFWVGERNDPETGLHHLLHAACELMFLHWMDMNIQDLDDRWIRNDIRQLKATIEKAKYETP